MQPVQAPINPQAPQVPGNQGQPPRPPVPPVQPSSWFSLDPDGMTCQWFDFFWNCLSNIFCFCCQENENPLPPAPPQNPPLTKAQRLSRELKEAWEASNSERIKKILEEEGDEIETLDLSQSRESAVSGFGTSAFPLHAIENEDKDLQAIMKGLKNLKTLDLTGQRQFTARSLTLCLIKNPLIKALILKDCVSLNQSDHKTIADTLKNRGLEVLSLDRAGVTKGVYGGKEAISKETLECYMKYNPGLHTLCFPGSDELPSLLESESFKALPLVYLDVIEPGSNSLRTFEQLEQDEKKAEKQMKAVLSAARQLPNLKELHFGHPHLELNAIFSVLQHAWSDYPKLERVVCFGKAPTLHNTMGLSGKSAVHLFGKNEAGEIVRERNLSDAETDSLFKLVNLGDTTAG